MSDPVPASVDSPHGTSATAYAGVAEKLQALSDPATYGPGTRAVKLVETHFAWVFLTEDRVYKLKKPIRAPELDLDTPAKRFHNCSEELRLNRALSPDVYLGLEKLVRGADGRLHLGGEGAVVDWLVQMRRLPEEQMLDRAIVAAHVPGDTVDAVARLLTNFYRRQLPIDIAPQAYVQRLADQIDANRRELLAADLVQDGAVVEQLIAAQREALEQLKGEVATRAAERRIIEAHGDLRPEHVCLASPPAIIDRLEFSLDLRVMDPCEELAYFSVECRHAGAAWVGERVFSRYRRETGDPISDALYSLYQSHRAATRAKIVAWHLRDPDCKSRQPWSAIAGQYLGAALDHLRASAGS
jgi:aminoglycoside phosphotransferase family enzyme